MKPFVHVVVNQGEWGTVYSLSIFNCIQFSVSIVFSEHGQHISLGVRLGFLSLNFGSDIWTEWKVTT